MCKIIRKGNKKSEFKGRFISEARIDASVSGVTRCDRVMVSCSGTSVSKTKPFSR